MRSIAPTVDAIAETYREGIPTSSNKQKFEAFKLLIDTQTALAAAERIMRITIDPNVLKGSVENQSFQTQSDRGERAWVRETYTLISGLHQLLRENTYKADTDPIKLLTSLVTTDTARSLSLPRLLRAFAKSSHFTHLFLGVPSHRQQMSIESSFNDKSLSRFLAYSTTAV